jgi:hypothetical protein
VQTTLPVAALVFIGLLLVGLGLFAAGNIWIVALGVASVAFAGVLQVWGARKS